MKYKHIITILIGGALVSSSLSCASNKFDSSRKLIWNDEFNRKGLPDSTKWNYDYGGSGFGNGESQFYTKKRLENARVEKGKLIIEARKEDWEEKKYTSARLLTKGKFSLQYGTVEVRAKLPKGRGTWPAIWMLSEKMRKWPNDGEIDIMEQAIFTLQLIQKINTQKTDTVIVKDASEKFHVYKMNWTPEKIEVYVDNKKFFTCINEEKTMMHGLLISHILLF